MEDELALLVDVTVPPEMDSPSLDFSRPVISNQSPHVSSKLTEDTSNKENADATIDSIEIERSDESDRRHSLTLSTPGALHQRILRDVTEKSICSNAVSSPVISMLEDEIFDFDFALSPASRSLEHSKEEEDDEEEVFFGPVGFAERCVAQSVGPQVKPLSPLNAGQIAELVKEAALVAYRLKTDCKNSSFNDSDSPPKKRHSRSGTFTMDNSPLKLLSLPIIESEEPSPGAVAAKKLDSSDKKNGNTVTKGSKENLLQQGRKLLTPNGTKSQRSGVVPPANKAKKSLQGIFKTKPAEKKPDVEITAGSGADTLRPDVRSQTSNPVPAIKQALTSKIPDKKSGLSRPVQRLQPPKSHFAIKAMDTSSVTSAATTGSRPSSLKRSLQPPKTYTKDSDQSTNSSIDTSSSKPLNNSNRRSLQPPKSSLAVKTDLSANRSINTTMNRRSLNTSVNVTSNRSITPASSTDKDSKPKVSSNNGTKLNRSYTISGPKSTQTSDIPGSKRPASKPSLLQPGQIKKKTLAMPNNTKVSNGPVKAIAPNGIQSRTVERKPSVRVGSSSSGQDVSMSTPIKLQKNVQPKLLSNTFTATPSSSGSSSNFMSSTPASANKRRSCLPTPNSSRTSSLGSIPPPSPLSFRSGSSTSSFGSVSDSPFTTGGRGRRLPKKQSVGTYGCLDDINENSPSALMPRKQRVVNTPNLPQQKTISKWSPVRKAKPLCLDEAVTQCTKRTFNR